MLICFFALKRTRAVVKAKGHERDLYLSRRNGFHLKGEQMSHETSRHVENVDARGRKKYIAFKRT